MVMYRLLSVATLAFGVSLAGPALAERSAITVTSEGHELKVVVHNVTDYCTTNAHTDVVRRGSTIRIVRDRPTRVSRCLDQRDVTFVVHDVPAGTYTVTYEQIPLVAPARTMTVASTTTTVPE